MTEKYYTEWFDHIDKQWKYDAAAKDFQEASLNMNNMDNDEVCARIMGEFTTGTECLVVNRTATLYGHSPRRRHAS